MTLHHSEFLPTMSVILVAASGGQSIARVMSKLQAQTVSSQLEIIVVARTREDVEGPWLDGECFTSLRVLEVGEITERGAAAAIGMKAATSRLVGLIEDHSFPQSAWAEHLIRAHKQPWAGVGPRVVNDNPNSATGWTNFILSYGSFSGEQVAGERELIPWHNSTYKRELLLPFMDRLGPLLEWEGELQEELRLKGHTLYLEADAVTSHMNVSRFGSGIRLNVQRGRILGALRAVREAWPLWNRLLRAAAFPLYPAMQLRYLLPMIARQDMSLWMRIKLFATLGLVLPAMAVGEARGLMFGIGDAVARLEDYELYRLQHITAKEKHELLAHGRHNAFRPPTAEHHSGAVV